MRPKVEVHIAVERAREVVSANLADAQYDAWAFALGMLLFCGAVYLPLFGGPGLGMTAPVGGTLLMLGWLVLGVSALHR